MRIQFESSAARVRRMGSCSLLALVLLRATVAAQPAQQAPAPAGPSPVPAFQAYLPALPPSIVPPRIEAPYPCTFPHSVIYEHPTRPTVLTFTVTAQGHVTNTAVVQSSGSGRVDEAARDCVSDWVYAPALRDGAPVDLPWAAEINF